MEDQAKLTRRQLKVILRLLKQAERLVLATPNTSAAFGFNCEEKERMASIISQLDRI